MGGGGGLPAAAGALLAAELVAPLLLLCGLCCWPDDSSDTSSNGKHPQKPIVSQESRQRVSRRRSSEAGARCGTSATSLHLPSTSGHSKLPPSHRSHEEIPRRSSQHLVPRADDARYHSAPSVIDEVIHRRDWERSSKELYIPLRPPELSDAESPSPTTSPATPSSPADLPSLPCKKHYTNIKSSKKTKESQQDDKDTDATENISNFYIGDSRSVTSALSRQGDDVPDEKLKTVYKAKDAKQSLNEKIKSKEQNSEVQSEGPHLGRFAVHADLDLDSGLDLGPARAAAAAGSYSSLARTTPPSTPNAEVVYYPEGGCYLAETGSLLRLRGLRGVEGKTRGVQTEAGGGGRLRHASDGDILAPTLRPESGAFSESDLELELEGSSEQPPPYDALGYRLVSDHKETAI